MKKFIPALMILFACVYANSAQTGRRGTAREKKTLFQLTLKTDDEIKQAVRDGTAAATLERDSSVEKIDFNADGQWEFVVVIKDGGICGAHANCPTWVYGKSGGGYRLLLRTFGQTLTPEKTSTNKYRDLHSEGSDSALQSSFTVYKFDGAKYRAANCFTRIYAANGKKEKIIPVKCQ